MSKNLTPELFFESDAYVDSVRQETSENRTKLLARAYSNVVWATRSATLKVHRLIDSDLLAANKANVLHAHSVGVYVRVFKVTMRFTLNGKSETKPVAIVGINDQNQAFLLSGSFTAMIANGKGEDTLKLQRTLELIKKAHELANAYRVSHNSASDTVPLPDDSFYRPIATTQRELAEFVYTDASAYLS